MKTFLEMAGTYTVKSPYHKKTKLLPFNIESDGFISTVEYKGNKPYFVSGFYNLEFLNSLIDEGIIKEGKASFPICLYKKD
jgi:hypothetical protein